MKKLNRSDDDDNSLTNAFNCALKVSIAHLLMSCLSHVVTPFFLAFCPTSVMHRCPSIMFMPALLIAHLSQAKLDEEKAKLINPNDAVISKLVSDTIISHPAGSHHRSTGKNLLTLVEWVNQALSTPILPVHQDTS